MRVTRVPVRGFALVLSVVSACSSTSRQPWFLSTEGLPQYRTTRIDDISTYEQALATTVDIMEHDLGLPRLKVRLIFVADSDDFESVLLGAGYPPGLARDTSRQMVAIGGHGNVLVNQGRFELRTWSWRLSTLAHELTHVLQYELGGGIRGASAQWLREGFAEWVEMRVLEVLGETDGAKALQQARVRLRSQARSRFPLVGPTSAHRQYLDQAWQRMWVPSLADLCTFPEWVEQSRGEAGPYLYEYASLAVASLIEEHGVAAVVRYFELFAERQDNPRNFEETFGEPEGEFEKRLHRSLLR